MACVLLLAKPGRAEIVRLADLERQALASRGSVHAQVARVEQAASEVELAHVPLHPTLGLGAQVDLVPKGSGDLVRLEDANGDEFLVQASRPVTDSTAFAPIPRIGASLSLATRLYDFGRTRSSIRAATAGVAAARAAVRAARTQSVLQVREAYAAWLLAAGTKEILSENVAAASSLRQALAGRVAEGVLPAAELTQARLDEARAALELSRGETQLILARLSLERVSGVPLPAPAEPDRELLSQSLPAALGGPAPQIEALERQRDAALASVHARASLHAPVLSGAAEAGVRAQSSDVFPVYRIGVAISVPLLDGGLAEASRHGARSQANELTALAREARAQAALERAQAINERNGSEARIHFAEQLLAAASDALRHAEDQREIGGGSLESVIQARIQRGRARLELLQARVARVQAALRLLPPEPPDPRSARPLRE